MQRLLGAYSVSPTSVSPESTPLEELFSLKQGTYTTDFCEDGTPVWGANGKIGFVNSSMYEEPIILVSCRGEYTGVVHYTDQPCWVSNNSIALFAPIGQIIPKFVYYLLAHHGLRSIVSGSAQPQIIVSDLNRVSIVLPDLQYQESSVQILSLVDQEISILAGLKSEITGHKKGLMQQLLTGKTRVSTADSSTKSTQEEYALNA